MPFVTAYVSLLVKDPVKLNIPEIELLSELTVFIVTDPEVANAAT